MFEWLEQELVTIKTKKFHVVDGPASAELRAAVEKNDFPIPRSYKDFVLRFGNARLYRMLDGYLLGVLASPREAASKEGDRLLLIGHYQSASAYFKEGLLNDEEESPVFEWGRQGLREIADGFEQWLDKRHRAARKRYRQREWASLLAGPSPFTELERRIVEARKLFSWRLVGVSPSGELRIEVHNASDIVLPFLSIGVRWKDWSLQGGMWLPVSDVFPKMTRVVEHKSYKKVSDVSEVEMYSLPDPGPEDRDRYWEFRGLSTS